jgi:tetratricopeptide (TPR) repeat protein
VLRTAILVLFLALASCAAAGFGQDSASNPGAQAPAEQAADATSATVSDQVADAEAAIVKSDWKTAEAGLDTWLAVHPVDARALFDAGYVADHQDRLDEAAGFYHRAAEANPKSFEAHLSLGLLLARQGKLALSREELATATLLDPGDAGPELKARAWRAMAEIDRPAPGRGEDTTAASNDLLEALKLSPETPADTLLAANLAEQAGQHDAAVAAYRRILANDPKSASANAGMAHLLIARKQYPEAETMLRTALEQIPDDPSLTAQLATVLAIQDKAEALPLVQKLHDSHPGDGAITKMLAEVLADAGDSAGSDRLYVDLLGSSPDDPVLLIGHGQNLIRLLKFADAFLAFAKATRLDPANADGWSGLAFAASRTSQPSITLHALTMRSKYLPENPSTYFLWATSYDSLHEKAQAISYYHRFLDAAAGKFSDQEFQARHRLILLENKK